MGSIEENELVEMVQDFIESGSTSATSSSSTNCHHRTQYFILQDILRSDEDHTAAEEDKVIKYVIKHIRGRQNYEKTTSLVRWLIRKMRKDGLNASLCQTSWSTSLGCPAGEYEYIEVISSEDEQNGEPVSVRMIVDIDFKSQFELARPTKYYKELTESVPVIFVGTENKLCKIISLLCSAAKQSLRENGLHVPPWRTTTYMQSKWLCVSHKGREKKYMGAKATNNNININNTNTKNKRDHLGGESALSTQLFV